MVIYKATLPNNKSYIGCTTLKLSDRIKGHKSNAKNTSTNMLFHKAIRKYGFNSVKWEVLFETNDAKILYKKEQEFIQTFNSLTPNGYNLTLGGEGWVGNKNSLGQKRTQTQLEKMRKAQQARVSPIVLIDTEKKQHKVFNSINELCRETNLPYQQIKVTVRRKSSYFQYKFCKLAEFNINDLNLYIINRNYRKQYRNKEVQLG